MQNQEPWNDNHAVSSRQVHLVSLGCARNRVDSEAMLSSLYDRGWKYTDEPRQAQLMIVNTCGFIEAAKEESIDTILELADVKEDNPQAKLVVAGCLTQRYKKQLAKGLPEVDFFLGTSEFNRLPELLEKSPEKGAVFARQAHFLHDGKRLNTLSKHSAYVKVAEGCQHNCAFCIIPAIRGRLRSKPIPNIIEEVSTLVAQGVLEVNLIAQDLAAYGRDMGQDMLLPLLRELTKVDGLKWIRLLYVYPENISEELLNFIATEDKIVKYLDMPVQHASDQVLQKMNRAVTQEDLRRIIKRMRKKIPKLWLRTTVMVGFPGETESEYQTLLSFIEEMKFDHLGCFTYSQEEGTPAARMMGQVPEEIKQQRQQELMERQQKISKENMSSYLGKELTVLYQGEYRDDVASWVARSEFQAPEVDGVTFLKKEPEAGQPLQRVQITAASEYDLFATPIS